MEKEVKRTERGDKIKLEDMTLKQIRELKEGYQIRVAEALSAIQNEFMEKYDCGFPIVKVSTEIKHEYYETELAEHILGHKWSEYDIKIKFSKEDD